MQASQGRGNPFPCINPKKTSKKKYVDSGKVFVQQLVVERVPSFLEYIQAGNNGGPLATVSKHLWQNHVAVKLCGKN